MMDETRTDQEARRAFRLAAPPVDTEAFCRETLTREAGRAAKSTRRLRRVRALRLRWKIAIAATGTAVVVAAVIGALSSSGATADQFGANLVMHGDHGMELKYLPDQGTWSETYATVLESPTAGTAVTAVKEGKGKPGFRVEQCLYQSGGLFIQIRTVTDTDAPLPEGQAVEVEHTPAVLQTGLSGTLEVKDPDLPAEFLGAKPEAGGPASTSTTASPDSFGDTDAGSSATVTDTPPNTGPVTYHESVRLTWVADGIRVEMLSNLPVPELIEVAEGLVPGYMT